MGTRDVMWKLHFRSSPERVFQFFSTDEGRASFWAETAPQREDMIYFSFPNGQHYNGRVLRCAPNSEFQLDYFNSTVKFTLEADGNGGTELTLIDEGIAEGEFEEVHSGWVSVLMNLKAVADFQVDLRNHDPRRTWDQKYVDN